MVAGEISDRQINVQGVVMLHGSRLTPLPHQWKAQMQAAAPAWNQMRQRQAEKDAAIKKRHQRLWDGFNIEDVVTRDPRPGSQKQSYGLSLCDDNGESVLMNGVMDWLR